jgi:F-type H+-transporting ATPase subunit epsilon
MPLKLTVLAPERKLLENFAVEEVTLFSSEGEIQILPGYAPIVGTLETGVFKYVGTDGSKATGVISSGFYDVKDDVVNVLAETIELAGEIDVDRAKRAQKLAEDNLKAAELTEQSFKKYQLKLERALIRQQASAR